jgi:uncharacterized membrane protein YdbT with pleckstrin-like domain
VTNRASTATDSTTNPETVLWVASPAMIRNRPVWFMLSVLLIAAYGVGLVILLLWWMSCRSTVLTVTNKRITLRTGLLTKRITEIMIRDIRNFQVEQSMMDRISGIGSIGISSSGQSGVEIAIAGIARPYKIKTIVDKYRP